MRIKALSTVLVASALASLLGTDRLQAQEPYVQKWTNHTGSTMEDIGTDVVSDLAGYSCVVGWVTVSETKTSYRLRILDRDGDEIVTDTWGPNNGIHKAYAVAIQQSVNNLTNPATVTTNIFVTGETHTTNDGQDIGTLKYTWVRYETEDGSSDLVSFTGPTVHKHDGPESGDDAGLDIGWIPNTSWVAVTGYADCGEDGFGSITIRYDTVYFTSEDPSYYSEYLYNNGVTEDADDVTVSLSSEPGSTGVSVAGYTQNSDDDYLLLRVNLLYGSLVEAWEYDSGWDERATAVTAQGSNGIFVTGWTDAPSLPIEESFGDGPGDPEIIVGPNFLTIRFDPSEDDPLWASLFNGMGNDADVAYDIAYSPSNTDDEPDPDIEYPVALAVGGASVGDETDFDYRVLMYDPADGTIMEDEDTDWTDPTAGVFNNTLDGPDEAFAIGVDLVPGNVYAAGRTWRTNSSVETFDCGTLRFMRNNGVSDDGSHDDGFPKFFFNGSGNGHDSLNALNVHSDGTSTEKNPDIFVAGYTYETSAEENIRTIMYHDSHRD